MSFNGDFLGLQLTVLQNNWKKAEDEVYRLDEFVERMRKVGVPLLQKPFTTPQVYFSLSLSVQTGEFMPPKKYHHNSLEAFRMLQAFYRIQIVMILQFRDYDSV